MEFYKKKLANGLTVLFEKRNLPVVSVSSSVNWGAAFENEKIKGISHFLEHLMFKGTKTRDAKQIAMEVEKKGGTLNAYTSEELTSYWNKLPCKHIDTGIEITSDLILNPKFDPIEFEREKNVIIEEIRMYHDNPQLYVFDKIKSLLYKKPFGMSVAGKEEIIRGLSRKHVQDLFKAYYTTDSMILCVVGNADFEEICKKAEKLYPTTKRKIIEHTPIKINSELIETRKDLEQAHFVLGFHCPTLKDRERFSYDVASCYLFEGMSSVLFQEIREKRGLAYAVKGTLDMGRDYGYGMIYVGTTKDKVKDCKEMIVKELKNIRNLSSKDLEECKEQLIGMKKVAIEDSSTVMNALVQEEIAGKAEEFYKYDENISSVKLEEIKKINIKNYSSIALVPC